MRTAVLDETGQLESEFGCELVEPIYDLIWAINTSPGISTSHTAVGTSGAVNDPDFPWASSSLGISFSVLPRDKERYHNPKIAVESTYLIAGILRERASKAPSSKGWVIRLRPETISCAYEPEPGFPPNTPEGFHVIDGHACEMINIGFAGERNRAGDRLSQACRFAAECFALLQRRTETASPLIHPVDDQQSGQPKA